MAGTLSEVDEIRRHMAQIRHELHQDVQGVVRGAEATADWRRYVRDYPWVMVGIAFGVGLLIVPRRQRTPAAPVQYLPAPPTQAQDHAAVAVAAEPAKKKGRGIFKTVVGLATPFILKSAQGYALQYFEQFLAQKMAQQQGPLSDLASFLNQGGPAASSVGPNEPPPRPPV